MDPIAVASRAQLEMFGQGRPELVDELTTPDVVDHGMPPGMPAGRDGVRATIGFIHASFDDVSYEIDDAFGSGDRVAIRCTFRGTHARAFMGRPPTGRSFAVQHVHIYRIEGDRIAEHWGSRDDLGMLHQLGLAGP